MTYWQLHQSRLPNSFIIYHKRNQKSSQKQILDLNKKLCSIKKTINSNLFKINFNQFQIIQTSNLTLNVIHNTVIFSSKYLPFTAFSLIGSPSIINSPCFNRLVPGCFIGVILNSEHLILNAGATHPPVSKLINHLMTCNLLALPGTI